MLSALIHKTYPLRQYNHKASFFIAKEISIIEVNMMWYPEKMNDHIARLYSLAQHVMVTFKGVDEAKVLSVLIRNRALKISTKLEQERI